MTEKISGSHRSPSRFIVFEGADGCGKTTQLHRLKNWLNQRPFAAAPSTVCTTKEPGATALGHQLRHLLLTPDSQAQGIDATAELLLYAADRAQHVQQVLLPHLARKDWVLCDRYCDSTIAYQGFGRGLDLSLIQQLNQISTAGLVSDLTLWLDLPVEETLERMRQRGAVDRMEQGGAMFLQRVHDGFRWLAEQHDDRIVRIDASGDEATVAARIQSAILGRFMAQSQR